MGSFQNCAKANFSEAAESSLGLQLGHDDDSSRGVITDTGAPSCREELQALTVPVRMIFVVDISGSNAGRSGTDPDKDVRAGSMQRFFNSYSSRVNFGWSLLTFAGASAIVITQNANALSMQNALNSFSSMKDEGNTPYVPALRSAADTIRADSSAPATTKYIVTFLSDGMPNPNVSESSLRSEVEKLIAVAPGRVSLNTVFYGDANADASERLRKMAAAGGGNFLNTNNNPTGNVFLISDLVQVPGVVCQ